jgi:Protein of unknown function (DUF1501)
MVTYDLHVQVTRDGASSRRSFLRRSASCLAGGAALGWASTLRSEADELRKRGMACIMLFLQGGASQFESWDPKPGTETGGPTKAIDTVLPGVRIAEHWPKVAQQLDDIALIRSMTGNENDHQRATYLLHTGYKVNASVKHPNIGSVAAMELGDAKLDLPAFVSISPGNTIGPGFLGMTYAPLSVQDVERMPRHVALPGGVKVTTMKRRLGLLDKLEHDFAQSGAQQLVADHRDLYETAAQLVSSPRLSIFDLTQESDTMRDGYGRTTVGQGCLMARRLIESGVTFVEVNSGGFSATTNWDTHKDNFEGHKRLAPPVDTALSALIQDLKSRGMLDRTLVICMGEFGRTPTINGNAGRDHFARAFSIALAGGGVRGGQVIGATDAAGTDVASRPVTIPDLFCSFYRALQIDPRQQNESNGRPIVLVEGGESVGELFGAT